jgi:hypothetical protein
MSNNPLNLAVRFILEVVALLVIGYWGWNQVTNAFRYLLAIGLPLLAAAAWATFRVPGDASASGDVPVPVPGFVRLILELALFSLAVWGLSGMGHRALAIIVGGIVLLHYAISYDRVVWLFRH